MANKARYSEFARLYWSENLTLREIGERFGVSRQRVHQALKQLGSELRPSGGWNERPTKFELIKQTADIPDIVKRYKESVVSVAGLARELRSSSRTVAKILISEGVVVRDARIGMKKFPEISALGVDEETVVQMPGARDPLASLYAMAKRQGMRVSVRTLGGGRFRVKRVG